MLNRIDYYNSVWECCGKTLASKLYKIQNRAARILTRTMMPTLIALTKDLDRLPIILVLYLFTVVASPIAP